jgi:hypothetical protein
MVVSLLAVAKHAVKHALPEVDPTQPAKLIPLRAAANNLSRCEGHFRALAVTWPSGLDCSEPHRSSCRASNSQGQQDVDDGIGPVLDYEFAASRDSLARLWDLRSIPTS